MYGNPSIVYTSTGSILLRFIKECLIIMGDRIEEEKNEKL